MAETFYTHIEKGGRYKLIGTSRGAGGMRGTELVVYQCASTGRVYHRTNSDFRMMMVKST